jgi:hypothetical protein
MITMATDLQLEQDADIGGPGAAAFALAEAITGVRLTAELFEQSMFICGGAPLPGGVEPCVCA